MMAFEAAGVLAVVACGVTEASGYATMAENIAIFPMNTIRRENRTPLERADIDPKEETMVPVHQASLSKPHFRIKSGEGSGEGSLSDISVFYIKPVKFFTKVYNKRAWLFPYIMPCIRRLAECMLETVDKHRK